MKHPKYDIHAMKEMTKGVVTTKCGQTTTIEFSTGWTSRVTCPECRR